MLFLCFTENRNDVWWNRSHLSCYIRCQCGRPTSPGQWSRLDYISPKDGKNNVDATEQPEYGNLNGMHHYAKRYMFRNISGWETGPFNLPSHEDSIEQTLIPFTDGHHLLIGKQHRFTGILELGIFTFTKISSMMRSHMALTWISMYITSCRILPYMTYFRHVDLYSVSFFLPPEV